MTPEEQRKSFIQTARDLECDESEERFNEALKKVARQKVEEPKGPSKSQQRKMRR